MPRNTSPLGRRSTCTSAPRASERLSPLELLRADPIVTEGDEALERALLAFDVDADIAAIVPMPATIPPLVRAAITQALGERFQEDDDAMEVWLHCSNEALGAATPFECMVAGDGIAVLSALLGPGNHGVVCALIAAVHSARSHLHLLR